MKLVHDHFTEKLKGCRTLYLQDLDALSHEQLSAHPHGKARAPYDFTFEVIYVNKRIAARLRGEDPGPFQMDGWMKAPLEFQDKDSVKAALESSIDDLAKAWEAITPEEMSREIVLSNGKTSPLDLVDHACVHMTYHDAQLNYVQELYGDMEMHWM